MSTRQAAVFPNLIRHLDNLNAGDVTFHAERYDSAQLYCRLIIDAQCARITNAPQLKLTVQKIAYACKDDGADYGSIPCLGGQPLTVWNWLREQYL